MSLRPNKAAIETALDEWTRLTVKALRITVQRDADLKPLRERFDKQCAPILNEATAKLQPLSERRTQLAAEIEKQLKLGIDVDKETVALPQVTVDAQVNSTRSVVGIAEVQIGDGDRTIAPEKFFDQTPAAKRDNKFWECLKVQIGKAEKYLGNAIDALAKKPKTFKVVLRIPEFESEKK